jgi:ketosteroid isomerase-like protein
MKNLLLFTFLCLLLNAGCTHNSKKDTVGSQFNLDSARNEIDKANLLFIDLFNKSDSVGLANMFTSDGKSMEPNEPSFIGRAKIQTHYSIVMSAGANKLGLSTTGLWGDEDMLAEEGEFIFMDKDEKQLDKGKYIVLWKQEDGNWKLFRDCYNSDLPVPR